MSNRFNDINDTRKLRANLIGRLQVVLGYSNQDKFDCRPAEEPEKLGEEILDDYYQRKEEITE